MKQIKDIKHLYGSDLNPGHVWTKDEVPEVRSQNTGVTVDCSCQKLHGGDIERNFP